MPFATMVDTVSLESYLIFMLDFIDNIRKVFQKDTIEKFDMYLQDKFKIIITRELYI